MRNFVNQTAVTVNRSRLLDCVERNTCGPIAGRMNLDRQALPVQGGDIGREIFRRMHQLAEPAITKSLAWFIRLEHGSRIGRRDAVEHDFGKLGIDTVRGVVTA